MQKNIIQKPEHVTHAEKYNKKYQSAFHTRKNIKQNTRTRSTHRKIKHKTPVLFKYERREEVPEESLPVNRMGSLDN